MCVCVCVCVTVYVCVYVCVCVCKCVLSCRFKLGSCNVWLRSGYLEEGHSINISLSPSAD